KMTLYRHFGSKDELVCETLRRASEKAGAILLVRAASAMASTPMPRMPRSRKSYEAVETIRSRGGMRYSGTAAGISFE
ncbi:hypothetical protein AB9F41_37860, partial [Rhizobium leguminosarum]